MKHAEKHTKTNNHSSPNLTNEKHTPFFQPKLTVGTPGDKYELEADKMADRVVEQSHEENQPFFAPAVSPPTHTVSSQTIQNLPAVDSVASEIQKQPEEEEEMMQMQMVEEEEMVQAQVGEEEEIVQQKQQTEQEFFEGNNGKIVQKQPEEEDDLQMQPEDEAELQAKMEDPENQVQAKAETSPSVPVEFETGLNSSKGGGSPLPGEVKSKMESEFGTDFSNVSIHTDSGAVQMSRQIGAQAFTYGNDIYFNEGKFNPDLQSGQHLIAHELTHTVQQGASVQPKRIQRVEENSSESESETITPSNEFEHPQKGTINTDDKRVILPNLPVPSFKAAFGPTSEFTIPKGGFPRNNNHIPEWEREAMAGTQFTQRFTDYATQSNTPNLSFNGQPVFYLVLKNETGRRGRSENDGDAGVIFGNLNDIKRRASRPYWTEQGVFKPHDVDHKRELQIGGAETDTANMWMLESSANRSSGSLIRNSKKNKVEELIRLGRDSLINPPSSYDDVKTNYEIVVQNGVVADNNLEVAGESGQHWELNQIQEGAHLGGLKFLTEAEVEAAGLRGSPEELILFTGLTGGLPIRIPWDEEARAAGRKDGLNIFIGKRGGSKVAINTVIYNSSTGEGNFGGTGTVICSFPVEEGLIERRTNLAYSVRPVPGVSYGGYIENDSVLQAALHALEFKYMSPITLSEAVLNDDTGLQASGTINPSIPLLGNAGIELIIDEQGARLRKLFQKSDFNMPAPFEISESTLEVFAGTEGFGINGELNFGIDQVGEGFLRGNFSTERGFALAGGFDFDTELFDPARIEINYENEELSVSGTIGIPEGKVRGVKSATITASYSENTFTASGEAELDIPGIQRGNMEVVYGEEGFSISGDFDLKDDIPGIRGGNVSATVAKQTGEEGYSVSVSGTAQPDIPGIDSSLTVSYDNGALTIEGSAAYSRGMLAGTVNIGATNRPIGEDGQPAGDPDDTMRVYGGGSLTLTLTPWLQATAGVQFLPNGEIEVTGRIGLPSSVDVFDRKSIDRNLFTAPAVEIPIFAIPLGPRSIGLVARITGGLDFSAGFGPGQLRDLYADVTYNPDREEETTITGHGEFAIPADAGLTLRGDLGLGVSVGIASLTGGIEIAGTLGLEGEAAAEVDVNWSPQTGLALDATGRITVNPKFTFDVNAFARASLDLWVTSISETWRYNLVSFSWGPDIQFGIVFPVHYREGEPFDMSFDDIQVIYPEIDVVDMAKGLARDIKNRIFD